MRFVLGILLHQWMDKENVLSFRTATFLEFSAVGFLILAYLLSDVVPLVFRLSVALSPFNWYFFHNSRFLSCLLSFRWLVVAGELSFAFYLWHQVVMTCLGLMNHLLKLSANLFLLSIIYFSVSLLSSILSFTLVEEPLGKWLKRKVKRESNPIYLH